MTCLVAALFLLAPAAFAQTEVVWTNPWNSTQTTVASRLRAAPVAEDTEAADDFDVTGRIERVEVGGYHCLNCAPSDVLGARVRFYAWTAAGPGALQAEHHLAAGDPRLRFDSLEPAVLEITLPAPFVAGGRHFVSVQLEVGDAGAWEWWVSNWAAPALSRFYHRDRLAGSGWTPYRDTWGNEIVADLAIKLWGQDGTPPPAGSDPCGTWIEEPAPDPAGARHLVLRDVEAIAADDVWAVGEVQEPTPGGSVVRTHTVHWNGAAWAIVPSPSPSYAPDAGWADLQSVAEDGQGTVWAAGTQTIRNSDGFVGSQVLVLRWRGSGWEIMDAPLTPAGGSGANVRGIAAIAPEDVWFVGDWVDASGGRGVQPGLAMRWNGSSFEPHNAPVLTSGGTGLEAISALGPDDIWAVGGGGDGDWIDVSTIFHWDGSTWEHVPGPTPGFYQRLFAVAAIAPDDVWAVGQFQDDRGILALVLHWDGSSWSQLDNDAGSLGLVAFASDDVYSTGNGIHHWDGTSWSRVEGFAGVNEPAIAAIDAAGPCELWATGRKVSVGLILGFAARIGVERRLDLLRDDSLRSLERAQADWSLILPLESPRDLYLAGIPDGGTDPDEVTGDASRPLVFYAAAAPGATIHLVKAGATVRIDF